MGTYMNSVVQALRENLKIHEKTVQQAAQEKTVQQAAQEKTVQQADDLAVRGSSRLMAMGTAEFRKTMARFLAIASLITIAAGLAMSDHAMTDHAMNDHAIVWPDAALLVGAIFSLVAVLVALAAASEPKEAARRFSEMQGEGIESRLEQLKDAQWVLSENETRYRDLLDTQDVMISRRDERGRLVFVNKAFCSAFGVLPLEVLGKKFTPNILDGQVYAPLSTERDKRRCYEELVQTQRGPRWISWEEQLVHLGSGYEVQSIGRDVSTEREAEALLTEARDQAQSANRAKSRFLAAMSSAGRT